MIFNWRVVRFVAVAFSSAILCMAQKDPGVRGGPPGAGGPITGLQPHEMDLFTEGFARTVQLESVCDTCSDVVIGSNTGEDPNLATLTNSSGLGTRFNGDQCSVCHQQPAVGGSGGFLVPNPQDPVSQHKKPENPMFDLIPHRKGGQNHVPSFITQYGPIREVRFQRNPDGSPDGGVHALFSVVGRSDIGAPGCTVSELPATDFETEYRKGNLSFRIPLQLFGLGLIESIQDQTIMSNSASTAQLRAPLGIGGMPNRSGNDGTITRFGWKAQNKSVAIFAGEAYNVEMGVTNDLFPTSRDETTPAPLGRTNRTISPAPTTPTFAIKASPIQCTRSPTGWPSRYSCGNWRLPSPCPYQPAPSVASSCSEPIRTTPASAVPSATRP